MGGPWRRLRSVVSAVKEDGRSPVFPYTVLTRQASSGDDQTDMVENLHHLEEYFELIAAIVKSGLKYEGPEYLRTHGGQFWCWMGGIEPEVVSDLAVNQRSDANATHSWDR